MPLDLATASRHADALSHHQRLLAAERLAAGDPLVLVAAAVHTDEGVLRVLDTDDGFRRLVDACRDLQELPREAWRERAGRLLRGAAERAIADGRVSTVNLILRATRALDDGPGTGEGWADDADADGDEPPPGGDGPLAHIPPELLHRMTRGQLLDCMLANDGGVVRQAFRVAERAADGIKAGRRLHLVAADESGQPYDTGPAHSPVYERAACSVVGAPRGDGRDTGRQGAGDGAVPGLAPAAAQPVPASESGSPLPKANTPATAALRLVTSCDVETCAGTPPVGFGPADLALPQPWWR